MLRDLKILDLPDLVVDITLSESRLYLIKIEFAITVLNTVVAHGDFVRGLAIFCYIEVQSSS